MLGFYAKNPGMDFKLIGYYVLISIPIVMTIVGLVYMIRTNCHLKEKCCKCCINLEKEDDNLDYGTYYYADGDRRLDVMEVKMSIHVHVSNTVNRGRVPKKQP